ncbi:MAG: serine--tRNA ligase [bacterium]|nr:serine--tRNA ligase [bacterium]
MLDIKFIRENIDAVKDSCYKRGVKCDIDGLLNIDGKRIKVMTRVENISAEKNRASKEITKADEKGKNKIIAQMKKIDKKGDKLKEELKEIEEKFNQLMLTIPNVILDGVPAGKDDTENVILEKVGKPTEFDFEPKDYMRLARSLDLIDVERAAKVSGSRFGYLKREAVLLEFALVNFTFETLVKKGFIPVVPPVIIKPEMAWAMGYLEQTNKDEAYHLGQDDLYLTATSEQTIGGMMAGEILKESELPIRYAGFSTCFRREAGSYGKDTKGILRVHQFDKIEMFSFVKSEDSKDEHKMLLETERELMDALKLSYQVVHICSGDLGAPAAEKFDIETWLPSENKYRETHSTSNCADFQARRLNVRYQKKEGKTEFVHTLNGTAFAIGRILIMIMENYQQEDGSIKVPDVLQKYTGFSEIKCRL